jgi:CubicO group peptidase (beta-lactamase class C family)
VRGVRGCHTQSRTGDEARRRIVEAIEAYRRHPCTATIVDDVKLRGAAQAVRSYATLRKEGRGKRSGELALPPAALPWEAFRERMSLGGGLKMSARDAARLLGLSHQRGTSEQSTRQTDSKRWTSRHELTHEYPEALSVARISPFCADKRD